MDWKNQQIKQMLFDGNIACMLECTN